MHSVDTEREVRDYEAKISKMISEGGIGVSAYYNYDDLNKDPLPDKPLDEQSNPNPSSSPPTT